MNKSLNTVLDFALWYHGLGWCVVPIGFGKTPPKRFDLTKYHTTMSSESELGEWFNNKYISLAVIAGEVSNNLTIVDFDSIEMYEKWSKYNQSLKDILPTVKTSRGIHVYCRSDLNKNIRYKKIDVIATRKYALLPPSRHPDKKTVYEWIIPPYSELPMLEGFEESLNVFTEETEEIEEIEAINVIRDITLNIQELQIENITQANIDKIREAIINTIPYEEGERNSRIFDFCRWIKSIEELSNLPTKSLRPIVNKWHQEALPVIGTKPFSKTWAEFVYGYNRVKWPRGDVILEQAVQKALANTEPVPKEEFFDCDEVRLLLRICYELQQAMGEQPFFLASRKGAGIIGVSHTTILKYLEMFIVEEILLPVDEYTPTKATRYRYIAE